MAMDGSAALSPGQRESAIVTSSGELNLHRDLCWLAKQTGKFPHKYMQVAKKKNHFKADIICK